MDHEEEEGGGWEVKREAGKRLTEEGGGGEADNQGRFGSPAEEKGLVKENYKWCQLKSQMI